MYKCTSVLTYICSLICYILCKRRFLQNVSREKEHIYDWLWSSRFTIRKIGERGCVNWFNHTQFQKKIVIPIRWYVKLRRSSYVPPKNFRNTELRRSTNKGQIVTSWITPTMRKSKRARVRTGTHWRLAPVKMLLFPDVRRVNHARGPSTCRVKNVPFFATYWVEYTIFKQHAV